MFRSSRPHSLPAHSRSASLRRFDLRTFRPSDLPTFHNSFLFRTSAKPGRKPFSICTSVALPDLRIPKDLRRLATPLFSALAGTSHKCGKQTTYNPCRICTYEKCARNSFRIRTYKNTGGEGSAGRSYDASSRRALLPISIQSNLSSSAHCSPLTTHGPSWNKSPARTSSPISTPR